MKNRVSFFLFITSLFLAVTGSYAEIQPQNLTVNVKGLEPGKGQVVVSIFSSKETFLEKPLVSKVMKVSNENTLTFIVPNLKKGVYAVSVIYDINNDGKLSTGFMGIPTEPVGMSNNAKGFLGPPSFKKASIQFSTSETISISLGKAKN